MARETLNDLVAFIAVAQAGSFTRAAESMGMTQSGVSHIVRGLEETLGVRLLNRTTRKVTPTEEGERLVAALAPRFADIEARLQALRHATGQVSGTVRITAIDIVADHIVWPRLAPLLKAHPGLRVEIETNYRMSEIVGERFDFGVRAGSGVAKDMIAARISPEYRRRIVASPAYLERWGVPTTPADLARHNCIAIRLSSSGGLYPWKLRKDGQELLHRPAGQLVLDNSYQVLNGALGGCGLAYTLALLADSHIAAGRLRTVLEDWSPLEHGFFLYYPNRRQPTRAMTVVIEALRHRPGTTVLPAAS